MGVESRRGLPEHPHEVLSNLLRALHLPSALSLLLAPSGDIEAQTTAEVPLSPEQERALAECLVRLINEKIKNEVHLGSPIAHQAVFHINPENPTFLLKQIERVFGTQTRIKFERVASAKLGLRKPTRGTLK